jgi:hypothetical protein
MQINSILSSSTLIYFTLTSSRAHISSSNILQYRCRGSTRVIICHYEVRQSSLNLLASKSYYINITFIVLCHSYQSEIHQYVTYFLSHTQETAQIISIHAAHDSRHRNVMYCPCRTATANNFP